MSEIQKYIDKKAIKILMSDEISGTKGRFSFNLEFTRNEIREFVNIICFENAIPLNTSDKDDIDFINEQIQEFYDNE